MTETFPRKPLLDRIIVREIPIADYYEQPKGIDVDLENAHMKERSDRGIVVAVGDCVPIGNVTLPMPVVIGDLVFFDEFALTDPIYLNPAHKHRHDLPRYFHMRVADLKGVDIENRVRLVDEFAKQKEQEQKDAAMASAVLQVAKASRPPYETFTSPTCKGSYALGTACGVCEKCQWERNQPTFPNA